MTGQQKKEWFLETFGGSVWDKWVAINADDSEQKFKYIHGGADQVACMINWDLVKVVENDDSEFEPNVFDI